MDPQAPAASGVLRADCAEVARRVRAGGERVAEELLGQKPDLDTEAALELIYAEVAAREEVGRPRPREEWLARFPGYAERLARLLDLHRAMADAPVSGTSVGAGDTFGGG